MAFDPAWLRQGLRAARSTYLYSYAGDNPLALTDPTGLFIRHGECANWDAALLLAKEKAGCESGHPGPPRCHCPLPAEICPYLAENLLPDAYIISPAVLGLNNYGASLADPRSGAFTGVAFNEMLCGNNKPYTQGITILAKTMIHEALHVAKHIGGVDVPGTNDAWSRKYLGWNLTFDKDAADITDSCF